jgi:hypothetical protein
MPGQWHPIVNRDAIPAFGGAGFGTSFGSQRADILFIGSLGGLLSPEHLVEVKLDTEKNSSFYGLSDDGPSHMSSGIFSAG